MSVVAGRQTVLVHHQTGIAGITVNALGYQPPHLHAAKVLSAVRRSMASQRLFPCRAKSERGRRSDLRKIPNSTLRTI